jgi:hypothetical protein
MTPDFTSPVVQYYPIAQNTTFKDGDFLILSQTGSNALTYSPTGALAGYAGPVAAAITFGTSASATAPAAAYFVYLTYTATGTESLASSEFVVNVPAGFVPTVSVSATGAPTGSTNFAAYMGIVPGNEQLQQATKTTTALGATYTAVFPLTNSIGAKAAATNVASGIIGLSYNDSNALFFDGPGGSSIVGAGSRLGATMNLPPLVPNAEIMEAPVLKLQSGFLLEMNLRQTIAWNTSLINQQVGLYQDPTTLIWVADTAQSNKVGYIYQSADGVPSITGTTNDLGKRVQISFLAAALS